MLKKTKYWGKAIQGVAVASLIFFGGCYNDDISELEKRLGKRPLSRAKTANR